MSALSTRTRDQSRDEWCQVGERVFGFRVGELIVMKRTRLTWWNPTTWFFNRKRIREVISIDKRRREVLLGLPHPPRDFRRKLS